MPLFSVIIPTYNRENTIAETLESLAHQQFRDFEVIVVDDGSTDRTLNVVDKFDGVRVFEQVNSGPCRARNLAARNADGEYLAFLDSDDVFLPWSLRIYAEAIQAHSEPALIVGERKDFATTSELWDLADQPLRSVHHRDYLASHGTALFLSASALVVRKDAFDSIGGFADGRVNAEDCDLCLRLGTAPGFVHVTQPAMFGYRRHSGSLVANFDRALAGQRMLISREQSGAYPGGSARARERRAILTRHVRPAALEFLRRGESAAAWELYRATLPWHVADGRGRFLLGFPILALKSKRIRHNPEQHSLSHRGSTS